MTTTITNCRWCGKSHGVKCPEVKAIEYYADGIRVKRVEFMCPSDYYVPWTPPLPLSPSPMRPPWEGPWVTTSGTTFITTKQAIGQLFNGEAG